MDERINIPSWDETFMNIAQVVGKRSKDPNTQVGACIVGEDNRILSLGYNGTPNDFPDDSFPWDNKSENPLKTKYPFVIHSERNAILNFRGNLREFKNSKIYVTHFPCNECAKEIVQVGIKEVIYFNEINTDNWIIEASKVLFKETETKIRVLKL